MFVTEHINPIIIIINSSIRQCVRILFFPLQLLIFLNNLIIQRQESSSVIDASEQDALCCTSDNVSNKRKAERF